MGAKTWMLVISEGDARERLRASHVLDRDRSLALARGLFPGETLSPLADGSLGMTCPRDDELVAGCLPGLSVLAAREFGLDRPSELPARFLAAAKGRTACLHAMHSVVDWFAYAVWENGRLRRSLSLSPDSGVLEDIGERLPFEHPFWAGEHPAVDPGEDASGYPFVFHPLALAEAALGERFGYSLEGFVDGGMIDPFQVPLMRFRRAAKPRPWWRRLTGA